jgi:hypothetical protein
MFSGIPPTKATAQMSSGGGFRDGISMPGLIGNRPVCEVTLAIVEGRTAQRLVVIETAICQMDGVISRLDSDAG